MLVAESLAVRVTLTHAATGTHEAGCRASRLLSAMCVYLCVHEGVYYRMSRSTGKCRPTLSLTSSSYYSPGSFIMKDVIFFSFLILIEHLPYGWLCTKQWDAVMHNTDKFSPSEKLYFSTNIRSPIRYIYMVL